MTRRPTRSTRTDPLFPCPTLFRSEIERVILPEVIFVFGQVEGRGELDRAFGALLMALRLELVAGIFARGRHAGEAGEPAGAAEADLDHRLDLVDVDPADRSDERRVGNECVSTCRSRSLPYNSNKNPITFCFVPSPFILLYTSITIHPL